MSQKSREYITELVGLMNEPNFKGVGERLYAKLILLKEFARISDHLQFIILGECHDDAGHDLQEGAFGAPPPGKGDFLTYPSDHKTLIVLRHRGLMWDLVRPVKGQETLFW